MSVVGFEVENKPRKQLLIVDILLRVFDEAVLETDTGNSMFDQNELSSFKTNVE